MDEEALLNEFVQALRADKKSEKTVHTYSHWLREFLSFVDRSPKEVRPEDVQAYKVRLSERVSAASIVVALAAVNSFLEHHGNYAANKVKRPRVPRKLPVPLSEGEADRLLEAASTDPLYQAVINVLYWTGMRSGSLRKLEWPDILWDEGRVVLREAKRGKTFTVLLPSQAAEALQTYEQYRAEPSLTSHADRIFISPRTGKPLTEAGVNYIVKKCAVKARIDKRVYPHLLRHTHGTIARKHGASLDAIAKQLGHESIDTTQLYAKLADATYELEYQSFFQQEPTKPERRPQPPSHDPDFDSAYR